MTRNTLQHAATSFNTLQHRYAASFVKSIVTRKPLQHTEPHCNTLQHAATHCKTLQHRYTASLVKSIVTLHPAKGSIRIIPALSRETAGTNLHKSSPQIFCVGKLVASWLLRISICIIPALVRNGWSKFSTVSSHLFCTTNVVESWLLRNVLQHIATCCNTLHTLQHTVTHQTSL